MLESFGGHRAGEEEEQRHVKAVDDEIDHAKWAAGGDIACVLQAPEAMAIDHQDDRQTARVINPSDAACATDATTSGRMGFEQALRCSGASERNVLRRHATPRA